jgi:hypothetical protein
MTIKRAKLPSEATTPISVALWSRVGTPHAAYVSFADLSTSTTVQLAALHAAAVFMKVVSAHKHGKSVGEQLDTGIVAMTQFAYILHE